MATLVSQLINRPGVQITYNIASSGGDDFSNSESEFLIFRNSGASTRTATIVTSGTVDGNAIADLVVAIPANSDIAVGPFKESIYGSSVSFTYADETNLGVALLTTGLIF